MSRNRYASRHNSRETSATELFYITRSLFHRNKVLVKKIQSMDLNSSMMS